MGRFFLRSAKDLILTYYFLGQSVHAHCGIFEGKEIASVVKVRHTCLFTVLMFKNLPKNLENTLFKLSLGRSQAMTIT